MTIPSAIGVDAGSATVKCVAVDKNGDIIGSIIETTKPRIADQVEQQIQTLLTQLGTNTDLQLPIVATGYGRKLVARANEHVTEITCHASGMFHSVKHGGTLIDVGGQDSKVIIIDENGHVIDFAMNDKCAAGTGRFLEHTAERLDIPLEKIGEIAVNNSHPAHITSTCTVFAETEIISLLAEGVSTDDILSGLHAALIARLVGLVKSVGFHPPLMMSGGVSKNKAVRVFLSRVFGSEAIVPPDPQLVGAHGAALIALKLN